MKNGAILIATWYDVIADKSATDGDFAETGCDERTGHYGAHELNDAVADFLSEYQKNYWDTSDVRVNDVLCASDPDVDYNDGSEAYDRLVISTDDPELRKRLQAALDAALDQI